MEDSQSNTNEQSEEPRKETQTQEMDGAQEANKTRKPLNKQKLITDYLLVKEVSTQKETKETGDFLTEEEKEGDHIETTKDNTARNVNVYHLLDNSDKKTNTQ